MRQFLTSLVLCADYFHCNIHCIQMQHASAAAILCVSVFHTHVETLEQIGSVTAMEATVSLCYISVLTYKWLRSNKTKMQTKILSHNSATNSEL